MILALPKSQRNCGIWRRIRTELIVIEMWSDGDRKFLYQGSFANTDCDAHMGGDSRGRCLWACGTARILLFSCSFPISNLRDCESQCSWKGGSRTSIVGGIAPPHFPCRRLPIDR